MVYAVPHNTLALRWYKPFLTQLQELGRYTLNGCWNTFRRITLFLDILLKPKIKVVSNFLILCNEGNKVHFCEENCVKIDYFPWFSS